jgi:integrase
VRIPSRHPEHASAGPGDQPFPRIVPQDTDIAPYRPTLAPTRDGPPGVSRERVPPGQAGASFPFRSDGRDDHRFRKPLDAIAQRVGWKAGEVRTKAFRHTYCAARLQTLDRGHPVSEFTVSREMGHGCFDLVRGVYGHVVGSPHRSEAVEYRIDQHVVEIRRSA